jgi:DNA-binding MarR family transcriptional regulator
MTKPVKRTKRAEIKLKRPLLSIPEQEAFSVLNEWSTNNDGRIPSIEEFIQAMAPVRQIKRARAGRLIQTLEKKGYVRRRLEVLAQEGGAA